MIKKLYYLFLVSILFGCRACIGGVNEELLDACEANDFGRARILIEEKGADVNTSDKDNMTPLMLSVYNGHTNLAQYLIEKGAQINVTGIHDLTPLKSACVNNRHKSHDLLIKELLCNGATFDPNDEGDMLGASEILAFDANVKDSSKMALFDAVQNKNTVFTKYQWLTYAIQKECIDQIRYAIDQGMFKPIDVLEGLLLRSSMSMMVVPMLLNKVDPMTAHKVCARVKELKNKQILEVIYPYQYMFNRLRKNKIIMVDGIKAVDRKRFKTTLCYTIPKEIIQIIVKYMSLEDLQHFVKISNVMK